MSVSLQALQNAYEAVLEDWTRSAEAEGGVRLYSASPELIDERLGIGMGVRTPSDGPEAIGIQIRHRSFEDLKDGKRLARLHGAVDRAKELVRAYSMPIHVLDILTARFPLVGQLRRGEPGFFSYFRKQCRPLRMGASLGRADGMTGTLGCFVKYTEAGPEPAIERGLLSCSHILARSYEATPDRRGKEGDAVYQPREPKRNPIDDHRVGILTRRFSILSQDVNNVHDVAVAKLTGDDRFTFTNTLAAGIEGCAISGRDLQPPVEDSVAPLMKVGKLGRSTGFTEGVVTAIGVTQRISSQFGGAFPFADLIEIAAKPGADYPMFSDSGDSGAVVFSLPDCRAIGVIVAGGENEPEEYRTYACDLFAALADLDVELV